MATVPILSRLNAFNNFIWYPDKGCYTAWMAFCLTDRSFISYFSSKKYTQKPSLISEEKLDHASLSDGSHVAAHLSHVHSHQTILSASTASQADWALHSVCPTRDHRPHSAEAEA